MALTRIVSPLLPTIVPTSNTFYNKPVPHVTRPMYFHVGALLLKYKCLKLAAGCGSISGIALMSGM